jgi:hypothetical protein
MRPLKALESSNKDTDMDTGTGVPSEASDFS